MEVERDPYRKRIGLTAHLRSQTREQTTPPRIKRKVRKEKCGV
jgi:hypothetical protein